MATLTYMHFGNPGRCYPKARFTIVHKKSMMRALLSFFYSTVCLTTDRTRERERESVSNACAQDQNKLSFALAVWRRIRSVETSID